MSPLERWYATVAGAMIALSGWPEFYGMTHEELTRWQIGWDIAVHIVGVLLLLRTRIGVKWECRHIDPAAPKERRHGN